MSASVIAAAELERFYTAVFAATGARTEQAAVAGRALAFADARGVESHGAANLERLYLPRLLDGRIEVSGQPQLVRDGAATAVIDARRCIGFVAAMRGMEEAIARASRYGVGAVGVRGSTHCGSMAFYTQAAVDAGMVGLAFTNLGRQRLLRPPGGAAPMLGTNVVAAAVPAGDRAPLSLDMSTAVVSTGRLRTALRRGESVPEGWLAGEDGRPVRDPRAFFDGSAHLHFLGGEEQTGGYKGFGLALLADVLCGVLVDGQVGPHEGETPAGGDDDEGIGHFMLALDVGAFRDAKGFLSQMDEMLGVLVNSPPARPGRGVTYPGLCEREAAAREFVELGPELVESLQRVATRLAIEPPALASVVQAG